MRKRGKLEKQKQKKINIIELNRIDEDKLNLNL